MDESAVRPLSRPSVARNIEKVGRVRYIAALASGAAAGVLRLESYGGFVFYLLCAVITSTLMAIALSLRKKGSGYYFEKPVKTVMFDGIIPGLSGFLLAWVLVYAFSEY